MIKYNNSNIKDWNYDAANIVKVYRNNAICYYKVVAGETAQTPCYAVVNDITQYQDTEFENVFNKADNKWYKLNNLNEYEEYGVYGSGRTECSGGTPTSRLPQGYTEVEYIENTSTAYINTYLQIYSSATNSFEVEAKLIAAMHDSQMYQNVFSCMSEDGEPYQGFTYRYQDSSLVCTSIPNGQNTFTIVNNEDSTQAVTVTSSTSQRTYTHTYPLTLFCGLDSSRNPFRWTNSKFYYCKIRMNDVLVRDFVPCKRNSDDKYGMYDIVNDMFYLSPNNVDFSGGEPITPTDCVTTYDGKLTIDDGFEYQYSENSWNNVGEVSGSTYPMYYDEMQDPPTQVSFSSMTEAEQYECPYVGLMATINGDLYIFNDNYQWELIPTPSSPKWLATYIGGTTSSAECDSTSAITQSEITLASLESVVIGDCVTSIGRQAFYNCSSLTSCTIGSGVTYIGGWAFNGCDSLTSITVNAATPPTLSSRAFQYTNDCPIYVPSASVETYKTAWSTYASRIQAIPSPSSYKFQATYSDSSSYSEECDSNTELTSASTKPSGYVASAMTTAVVGDCITSLGTDAFRDCSGLTSITLPSGLTSIGENSIRSCTSLSSITIPNSVTSIGEGAFRYCISLTSITIPDSVTSIGNSGFCHCSAATSINIGSSVTSIGNFAFGRITGVTSLNIPNNVTSIGNTSFRYCNSLTSVTIGSGVTSIGSNAFSDCSHLNSITINATTPPTLGSTAFSNTKLCPIYVPCESVSAYKTTWSDYASRIQECPTPSFDGKWIAYNGGATSYSAACGNSSAITQSDVRQGDYTNYTKLIIGDCVTEIREAFQRCESLLEVEIGENVTTDLYYCFQNCTALTSVTWYATSLIGQDGGFDGCTSLQKLVLYATTPPPYTSITMFKNVPQNMVVYVPDNAVSAYQSARIWGDFTIRGHSEL